MKKYISILALLVFPIVTFAGGAGGVVPENAKKVSPQKIEKNASPSGDTQMEKKTEPVKETSSLSTKKKIATRADAVVSQIPVDRGINQQDSFDIAKAKDEIAAKKLQRFRSIMKRSRR